ncbi:MAG: cytochrome ubiquinol oxidase subunit [Caulobacteraceae bacterium]|nr:cytochrome ubiquinol oxidase subunit [Caulobacteraceae bacterium]
MDIAAPHSTDPLLDPEEPDLSDLDPKDWTAARAQAHRMLDDILDHVQQVREGPVWRPIPEAVRAEFAASLPWSPCDLADVHADFKRLILPHATGNLHPRFMGWVHGGGNVAGMLADMLAAGLNANLGGRDHIPVEVERQVTRWMAELFGFPAQASGLFVTGTSLANLIAVLAARADALGSGSRIDGVAQGVGGLVAYASAAAHSCIAKALDIAGLGSGALRLIATDDAGRMDPARLAPVIAADRAAGLQPFLIVGTAGTVDIGAVDDLTALADIAEREHLWLHVDGAFGALGRLSPDLAPLFAGIERAQSIAFDFHKWGQAPYDAGFVLMRDEAKHRAAFASTAPYLERQARGMAAGQPWLCDYGPDLSRGFRALKVWFAFKTYGAAAIGRAIAKTCRLAQALARGVDAEPELERLAPVALNIVCFRYRGPDADRLNAEIVTALQESGVAAPSTTVLDGRLAIRAAIVNHRTRAEDIDILVREVLRLGRALSGSFGDAS